MAARCIAAIATRDIIAVMKKVISLILPLVNAADCVIKRQGGVEAITALTESLQLNIIPYIVLLIIPLLGMSVEFSYIFYFVLSFSIPIYYQLHSVSRKNE